MLTPYFTPMSIPKFLFTEIEHTVAERKILAQNTNPFLVSLKFSFQTAEKIYFVLDYICGGELFVHLQVWQLLLQLRTLYDDGIRSVKAVSARSERVCMQRC